MSGGNTFSDDDFRDASAEPVDGELVQSNEPSTERIVPYFVLEKREDLSPWKDRRYHIRIFGALATMCGIEASSTERSYRVDPLDLKILKVKSKSAIKKLSTQHRHSPAFKCCRVCKPRFLSAHCGQQKPAVNSSHRESSTMKDVRVEIRVKNNALYKHIRPAFKSARQFAIVCGVKEQYVTDVLALRVSPWKKNGDMKEWAKRIQDFVGDDAEIFPEHLYRNPGEKVSVLELSSSDFFTNKPLIDPGTRIEKLMIGREVSDALSTLSKRESMIIKERFGIGRKDQASQTLDVVSAKFRITRERCRQIESKAIRKLRHPTRSKSLREYL